MAAATTGTETGPDIVDHGYGVAVLAGAGLSALLGAVVATGVTAVHRRSGPPGGGFAAWMRPLIPPTASRRGQALGVPGCAGTGPVHWHSGVVAGRVRGRPPAYGSIGTHLDGCGASAVDEVRRITRVGLPYRCVHLIGRETEAERIDELVDSVRNGWNGAFVVRGEAGAGKTAPLNPARPPHLQVARGDGDGPTLPILHSETL